MSKTNTMTAGTTASASAVNQNFDELGLLGYAEVTASQGSITTEVDLTGLTVTVNISAAFATAGRKIKITAQVRFQTTVAADTGACRIKEGATTLMGSDMPLPGTALSYTICFEKILTPTSGSHTYKLSGLRDAGTGTLTMVANASNAAFILVEAI